MKAGMRTIMLKEVVPKKLHKALKQSALDQGKTLKDVCLEALAEAVKPQHQRSKP